jgi:hypothetical protein
MTPAERQRRARADPRPRVLFGRKSTPRLRRAVRRHRRPLPSTGLASRRTGRPASAFNGIVAGRTHPPSAGPNCVMLPPARPSAARAPRRPRQESLGRGARSSPRALRARPPARYWAPKVRQNERCTRHRRRRSEPARYGPLNCPPIKPCCVMWYIPCHRVQCLACFRERVIYVLVPTWCR